MYTYYPMYYPAHLTCTDDRSTLLSVWLYADMLLKAAMTIWSNDVDVN
jgi:hypothetical protein